MTVGVNPTAQELWRRYHQQADADAENALIEKYLTLVSSIVARLAMTLPEHVDQDDLYSAGLVGLLQALRNYDPTCGASFETYARTRVRGAMLDELRKMDWVPRTVHEKARMSCPFCEISSPPADPICAARPAPAIRPTVGPTHSTRRASERFQQDEEVRRLGAKSRAEKRVLGSSGNDSGCR